MSTTKMVQGRCQSFEMVAAKFAAGVESAPRILCGRSLTAAAAEKLGLGCHAAAGSECSTVVGKAQVHRVQ